MLLIPMAVAACDADPGAEPDVVPEGATDPAPAEPPSDGAFTARVAGARRVLHAQVTDLAYRITEDGPLAGAPRTRVTFTAPDGATTELEFLGGELPDGRSMRVSDLPRFTLGDEVVLAIGDDLTNGCPLVGCDRGVLRLEGEDVLDDAGHHLGDRAALLAEVRR